MTSANDPMLGQLLCAIALDRSIETPIAAFTRELLSARDSQQSLEETVAQREHELAEEAAAIAARLDQCNIAREKLRAELLRVDQQVVELKKRQEEVQLNAKFCKVGRGIDFTGAASLGAPMLSTTGGPGGGNAAAARQPEASRAQAAPSNHQDPSAAYEHESQRSESTNSNKPAEAPQQVPPAAAAGESGPGSEALLNALRNPDTKEPILAAALTRCEGYHMGQIRTELDSSELKSAMQVATAVTSHLLEPRPPLQVTEMRILIVLLRRARVNNVPHIAATIIDSRAIESLVKLIGSVNDDVKCEAFELLNLLITEDTTTTFVSAGGVPPLVQVVASSSSEPVLERSLVVLWTLASVGDQMRSMIREEGGLRAVLDLLYTDSMAILTHVTDALGYLSREVASQDALRENGGLEKLVATLHHPSTVIQQKVAGALWNCASNPENRGYLRQLGAIPVLLELLEHHRGVPKAVQENAAGCLWNLAVNEDNRAQIPEYNGINVLIGLLDIDAKREENTTLVENATGTLWNLSSCIEHRPAMRKSGAIPFVLRLLAHPHFKIAENAAGLLRNLSINDQNKSEIRENGGVEALLSVMEHGKSVQLLEKQVSCLWILAIAVEVKHSIRTAGGIPVLVNMLQAHATNESLKEKVAGVLRNVSALQENRKPLIDIGIMSVLKEQIAPTLSHSPPTVKEHIAALIWNLSRDDKEAAVRSGLMPPLCQLVGDRERAVIENATGALSSLTMSSTENRAMVRTHGGLETALRHLSAMDGTKAPQLLNNLLLLIRNCTTSITSNQQLMVQMHSVSALLAIVDRGPEDLAREAALCLKNAASIPQGVAEIQNARGIDSLRRLAESAQSEAARKAAAVALNMVNKTLGR